MEESEGKVVEDKCVPSIIVTDATMVAASPPSPREEAPPPSPPSPEVKKQPASRRSSIATARRMSRYQEENFTISEVCARICHCFE